MSSMYICMCCALRLLCSFYIMSEGSEGREGGREGEREGGRGVKEGRREGGKE